MQVEHKTEKVTILFVKVSDDSFAHWHNPEIKHLIHYHTPQLEGMSDIDVHSIELDSNDWQLIGLTSEITEEQARMMGLISVSNFRKEIEKLQVYEVNPYGEECPTHGFAHEHEKYFAELIFEAYIKKWQETQSRTGKWLVLFKPEI